MRVLVCGSGYGQMYLDGLAMGGRHVAAGLLARGSERSQQLASAMRIPLYTSAEDVPAVDLACVAIDGEAGTAISESLLRRGIPVLREHAVGEPELDRMIAAAETGRTVVHVNSHFGDFQPAADFIAKARLMLEISTPLLVQMSLDGHLGYAMFDVVGRVLGKLDGHFDAPSTRSIGPDGQLRIAVCQGEMGGVPVVITQSRSWALENDRSSSFVGDEIALCFSRGRLSCVGFPGTTVLTRNSWALTQPLRRGVSEEARRFYEGDGSQVTAATPESSHISEERVRRLRANLVAMDLLADHAGGGPCPSHQEPDYHRQLVRRWSEATRWAPMNHIDAHAICVR